MKFALLTAALVLSFSTLVRAEQPTPTVIDGGETSFAADMMKNIASSRGATIVLSTATVLKIQQGATTCTRITANGAHTYLCEIGTH